MKKLSWKGKKNIWSFIHNDKKIWLLKKAMVAASKLLPTIEFPDELTTQEAQ
jgi:hypothetical protein